MIGVNIWENRGKHFSIFIITGGEWGLVDLISGKQTFIEYMKALLHKTAEKY
jgi:hypothetical protein